MVHPSTTWDRREWIGRILLVVSSSSSEGHGFSKTNKGKNKKIATEIHRC